MRNSKTVPTPTLISAPRPLSRSLCQFGLAGALASGAIALTVSAASAAPLSDWRYDTTVNQLEVTVKAGTTPRYFLMAQPARIVLDLPNTQVGNVKVQESYGGAVRQVRVSQFQPGLTRIVMELSPDVTLAPAQAKLEKATSQAQGDRWVLRPLIANQAGATTTPRPFSASPQPVFQQVTKPAVNSPPQVTAQPQTPGLPPPPGFSASRVAPLAATDANSTEMLPGATPINVLPPPAVTVPPVSLSPVPLPPATVTNPSVRPMPLTAMGSDFTAVTREPDPIPAPLQSAKATAQPGTPLVAQALPDSATTPLPPTAVPSPNPAPVGIAAPELTVDTRNAIKLSVPAPAALSSSGLIKPTIATGSSGAAIAMPGVGSITTSSAGRITTSSNGVTSGNAAAIEIPSSIKFLANVPPQVSVPPLAPLSPTPLPPPVAVPTQSPSIISVPPLNAPPVYPGNVSPLMVPPASSVIRPPTTSVIQPPASSVMQPLPASLQPPVSSVMQMPNSAVMQGPGGNGGPPPGFSASPLPGMPSEPSGVQSGMVTVPPLQPFSATPSVSPGAASPGAAFPGASVTAPQPATPPAIVEFGQPLPLTGATALNTVPQGVPGGSITTTWQQPVFQSSVPGVILPMGTTLNLIYPGNAELRLESGMPRQEVLLLQTEVRDALGNVVLPQGSYVMGQFETGRGGSKFIAQSIAVGSRTLPFVAESELISGTNRELSTPSLALYSGAGALAGGLVSKFSGWGILLGGAAGAATNYFTAPKPAAIQPGQMILVRVAQEIR